LIDGIADFRFTIADWCDVTADFRLSRLLVDRRGSCRTAFSIDNRQSAIPEGGLEMMSDAGYRNSLRGFCFWGKAGALCVMMALGLVAGLFPVVGAGKPAARRPPIVGVANIGLKTDNLEAAREFYGKILGYQEAFRLDKPTGGLMQTCFKVNDHQYIELSPDLASPTEDRLSHVAFETTDAQALRDYLAAQDVAVPQAVRRGRDGNLILEVKDPDGHSVEFVEYLPGSLQARNFGKYLPETRISQRIIHVGVTVVDRAAADRFYGDILGFHLQWYGGMTDDRVDWVAMRVPEGHDWLEYMLNVHNPSPRTLGVMHHLALGVPSVKTAYKTVVRRGYNAEQPKIGRDGKWQLNLYDPDYTRAELMEPKPVTQPCCSPMLGQ
jgi:lactoylglutathione lyase